MKRLAALALLATGCTSLGLTDVPPQEAGCRSCGELNLIDPPPQCQSWQCADPEAREESVCVLDVQDLDEDGVPAAGCVLRGPRDCDDTDPANAERGDGEVDECLDGQDNDCDDAVDEALFVRELTDAVPRAGLDALSWTADGTVAVFREGGALELLEGTAVRALDGPVLVGADPDATALASIGTGLLLAYRPSGVACPRIVVGAIVGAGLDAPAGHPDVGLPKIGGGCEVANDTVVGWPALAWDGTEDAVALWLEGDADRTSCGAPGSAVAVAQLAVGAGAPRATSSAVELGTHGGLGGVPLLATGDDELLAAIVTPSGTVELRRLLAGDPFTVQETPLHVEPTCGAGCGWAALASGPGSTLALAFRAGGCDDAEIRVRRFAVDAGAVTPLDAEPVVIEAGSPSHLAIAAVDDGWALTWLEGPELRFAQIDPDGAASPVASVHVHEAPFRGPVGVDATSRPGQTVLRTYDPGAQLLFDHVFTRCGR